VHDAYLWLEDPIPITKNLIHHISRLSCKGKDPTTILEGKGSDFALAKAMKIKYKLEKRRGAMLSPASRTKW